MIFFKKLTLLSSVSVMLLSVLLFKISQKGPDRDSSLMMYCAAGLKPPILRAANEFEVSYGVKVELQFGGSGTLLNNLQVAHHGDLYLAADSSFMNLAEEKSLIKQGFPLVKMRPTLAVKKGNPKQISGVSDLLKKEIRLSLGNPEAASIGKMSKNILQQMGLWKKLKHVVEERGVFKPTVSEIANDIKLGSVDAGIIWDATVQQYEDLEPVQVEGFGHIESSVMIAILNSSKKVDLAKRWMAFLKSEVGREFFRAEGYLVNDLAAETQWRSELVGDRQQVALKPSRF